MHRDFPASSPWVDVPDPGRDMALAQQAVTYLRERGLDEQAVVQALRDEFEIDVDTATAIALRRAVDLGGR